MKFPIWLLAVAGAFIGAGPAFAQTLPPDAGGAGFQADPLLNLMTPRVAPTRKEQSPDAQACADATGKVAAQARADACGKLIDSGEWKGTDIAWAYANRCYAFKKLGQQDKALADCDKAVALDEKNAVAYQARGMILQDKGDSDGALVSFDKAVENGANNAAIFSDRGNILLAKGETDKALADYDKALGFNGKSVTVLLERGGAWLVKGRADEALADYAKATELAPKDAFAVYNRGVAYFVKGDKGKAIEEFKQALKLDPKNAYASLWLFLARPTAEGRAELQRYAAKLPQNAWPWPVVQYDLGASDAQKTLAAAKTPGDQCEAQFYIGSERLAKGAKDEGLAYLRKAAEICPKNFVEYIQAAAQLKALSQIEPPKTEPTKTTPSPQAEPSSAAPTPAPGGEEKK